MDALTAWLAASPLPWLVLTMLAYTFTLAVYRRSGAHPLLIPPLTATALVVAVLLLTGTPYATYREGVGLLSFLIGPATVALAVPLFAQRERIRQLWRPIGVALLVGGTVAIVSALLIAWALGGTRETLMALAPKSATMPIALPVAERMGGPASLAAVAVAITGIAGAVLAAPLMRLLRVVRGFAIGLTAHAIGTARELQVHPTAGAFAALAMSLNGVATAVLVPLCVAAMPWL
jgi:putative effector of murein hydrolase